MKTLIIGSGGREHALAWKLLQSAKVTQLFMAPGNAGTALEKDIQNIPFVGVGDIAELVQWALTKEIDLTVVGPEAPLAAGVVDAFQAAGLRIFGPSKMAARLESSKAFSKAFMQQHDIPTAFFSVFEDAQAAHAYVTEQGAPIVVKADGLAAGKGVVVAMTEDEAHSAIDSILGADALGVQYDQSEDGQTRARVVIESYLEGEEASFIALCDGENVLPLASSQDHKRLLDDDKGPNTGGMGAYSPAPMVTPEMHSKILRQVILPTVRGMAEMGCPFTGFLYAGIMIGSQGEVQTLEFNCRLGDPETQAILPRIKSDLFDALWAATQGQLDKQDLEWSHQVSMAVVLAAQGYPQAVRKGDAILDYQTEQEGVVVFHAATKLGEDGVSIVTNGGRVLCVSALGASMREVQSKVYAVAEQIQFDGKQYRKDIGHRALKPRTPV